MGFFEKFIPVSRKEQKPTSNPISEISGLDGLTNLQKLGPDGNQITEISGLDGLTNLQELAISENQASGEEETGEEENEGILEDKEDEEKQIDNEK